MTNHFLKAHMTARVLAVLGCVGVTAVPRVVAAHHRLFFNGIACAAGRDVPAVACEHQVDGGARS
jgi:hypothetical protein